MIEMDQKEFTKMLKNALQSGKLNVGTESTIALLRSSGAKLVAIAQNSPEKEEILKYAKGRGVEVFEFTGDSIELGKLCKKPFGVAALAISE